MVESVLEPMNGTQLSIAVGGLEEEEAEWSGVVGPPVPVCVRSSVISVLAEAALSWPQGEGQPRVFRLFMLRGQPRIVVDISGIKDVWRNGRGVVRWKEGGYPTRLQKLRKGGNAFIRGDMRFEATDAWWMGREQTDLRLLLKAEADRVSVSAWWSRAGTEGLAGRHETD